MLDLTGTNMTISRAVVALPIIAVLAAVQVFGGSKEQFLLDEGSELYHAQKFKEAIAQFDQLLERDPTNWSANYLTALSYWGLYHPGSERPDDKEYAQKGVAALERTLKLTPPSPEERDSAEAYYLSFLDATGDRDKAIAYFEKQLASRPKEPALFNQLAPLYIKKGEFAKALGYYEKRASIDPTSKEGWYTLGAECWALAHHGDPALSDVERVQVVDKGIQALEKALAIDPDYFEAVSYASLLYREKAKALNTSGARTTRGCATFDVNVEPPVCRHAGYEGAAFGPRSLPREG
jgi:tetratricopeptide (TPR) repeat protein